jgi:hypothetical protein
MEKIKLIKSLIGIGMIGAIGLGVSAGIASCGKATTTDVVSFDSNYQPSMTSGHEQIYHASSSMDGKISYAAVNLPDSGVDFDDSSGKLNYTTAVPVNQDITINATSDKGGHSSIRITLLADAPTPALSASILNNNLQLGTEGTATLSVTEINATE